MQGARQGLAEPLEIVERRRGVLLQAAGEIADLGVQAVEGVAVLGRAGIPRGFRGLRQLVEPRVELIEGLAVAALAILDPLHQAAQQTFDGALIHWLLRREGGAAPAGVARLPTCF